MMKVSLILTAVDRITAPVRQALRSIEALNATTGSAGRGASESMGVAVRETRAVGKAAETAANSARRMGTEIGRVGRETGRIGMHWSQFDDAGRIFTATATAAAKLPAPVEKATRAVRQLGTIAVASGRSVQTSFLGMYDTSRDAAAHFRVLAGEGGMARASRSAAYLRRQVHGLTAGLSILKYVSAGAAIGLGEEFVRGVFHAGGEMDGMRRTLETVYHSSEKARRSLAWMQNFSMGAGARFSMPQIMQAYQQATVMGMNPEGGSLKGIADLAAAEPRVGLNRIFIAIKDAMEGTSARPLKNLGINMHIGKKDKPDTYSWYDAFKKKHTATSTKDQQSVLVTLQRIIDSLYGGLAVSQAKTLPAGIEILKKKLFMFEAQVASSGVYDWAIGRLNQFFAWINRMSQSGDLTRLAKSISDTMITIGDRIIDFFVHTNWKVIGADLAALAGIVTGLGSAFGFFVNLAGGGLTGFFNLLVVSKIIGITTALAGFSEVIAATTVMLTGFDIAAAPIALTIAAIGALIAVGYLLWANWDRVTGFFSRVWNKLAAFAHAGVAQFIPIIGPLITAATAIVDHWKPLAAFFERLFARLNSFRPPAWMDALGGIGQIATGNIAGGAVSLAGAIGAHGAPLKPAAPKLSPTLRAAAERLSAGPGQLKRGESTLTIDFKNEPPGMRVRRIDAHPGQVINVKRGPVGMGG